MKTILAVFLTFGTMSAFAKQIKYKCNYIDSTIADSMHVGNSFEVKFKEEGLRMNDLSISISKSTILIEHIVNQKIINGQLVPLDQKQFSFHSETKSDEAEKMVDIVCFKM